MQFHYHTLHHLAQWMNQHLRGVEVEAAFSQNRNELILGFADDQFLRIGCHTPLTYLVPVEGYARARKNVVDLFPELPGQRLSHTEALPFDRVLILHFEDGWNLVAKMHSISSNVLLRQGEEVVALFNHQLDQDWEFTAQPGEFHPEAARQEVPAEPEAVKKALRSIAVVYDKLFVSRCLALMTGGRSFEKAFAVLQQEIESGDCYLYREGSRVRFSLIPLPEAEMKVKGVVNGLQTFLRVHFQLEAYRHQYKQLDEAIRKPLDKKEKLLASYQESISQMETLRNPEELGHLLMAYLHLVEPGQETVTLPDLYLEGDITISLDPKLSPQENATKYYHKHKNRKFKLMHLKEQVEELETDLLEGMADLEAFAKLPSPEDLRLCPQGWEGDAFQAIKPLLKKHRQEEQEAAGRQLPFRVFQRDGYEILVGKNARNNDELSFHVASKQDLWLHAKDVTGSHVIVRHRAGRDLPGHVLEYAASLAAYFSKRKSDTLVPVIYTPRKYIRKRKGDPPGLVVVEREQVIMVEPLRS